MEDNKNIKNQSSEPVVDTTAEMDKIMSELRDEAQQLLDNAGLSASEQFDAVVDEAGEIDGLLSEEVVGCADDIPEILKSEDKPEDTVPTEEKNEKKTAKTKKSAKTLTGGKDKETAAKKDKKDKKQKTGKRTFWQKFVRFCIVCICLGLIAVSAVGVAATIYLMDVTAEDNKVLDIDQIKLSFATILMAYDEESDSWYEYKRLFSGENRIWVEYGDMPQHLLDAIVANEDHRFYEHPGVDWRRTIFAFINEYLYKTRDTQGGSTLTQQLIKNITDEKAVSGFDGVLRKLREIYRALEMEKNYSKEQILEAYLNTFRLSGQVAGIESAANYYFGKTTGDLTVAECAAIVCITKAPGANNPYTHPDVNRTQRNQVLYNMLNYGYLTQAQYDAARAESDAMEFDESNKSTASGSSVYSYFTDAVIDEIIDDFKTHLGMTGAEAYEYLFQGGLTVYLTMDPKIQQRVEEVAFDTTLWPAIKYEADGVTPQSNQIEGAMVVMNYEGEVLGIAGGVRSKTTSRSLNRATSAKRQTGSSMKPLAAYAPGIELNKIHFSSLFPDTASAIINGKPWPTNFSNNYGTPITVYKGLALSLNTTAIHVLNLVGEDFAFDFLTTSLGFKNLVDYVWSESQNKYITDRTRSLALGALTDGVTVLEMTSAYAIFGNGGVYTSPHFYTHICDKSGDVVFDKTKYITTSQAISPETAEIMNQLLRGVIKEGTGTRAAHGKMPLCGKSGTTSDNNDFWFIGENPYYVMGVWMGYDMNGKMPYSIHYTTQTAFKNVMSTISADLPYKNFPTTGKLVVAEFCMSSGDLATGGCPNTRTGYYRKDNVPDYCNHGFYSNDGEGGGDTPIYDPLAPAA